MDQKYSHAHDAVALADRLPLLIMITVSVGFFFFPMQLYNVVRSGVDPLIAKIVRVVPIASLERETVEVNGETTSLSKTPDPLLLTHTPSPLPPSPLRGRE
jgi:NADH-quinone oxidoreductase subunit M